MKLINKTSLYNTLELSKHDMLACLSQRIPIEFISTHYVPSEWRQKFVEEETRQVESHMRICLKIEREIETMTTVAASEPLLSEASFLLMQMKGFSAPNALKEVLSGFAVAKGDRGEFLVLLQAILARDSVVREMNPSLESFWSASLNYSDRKEWDRMIPLDKFLHQLLRIPKGSELAKEVAKFKGARLHFNHFVKLHESDVINAQCLTALFTRGAGELCSTGQKSIDIIIPVLLPPDPSNPGLFVVDSRRIVLIAIQVKNDFKFKAKPQFHLCDSMVKTLKECNAPKALFRIVFALASDEPAMRFEEKDGGYNIYCAGLSPDVLPQVKEEEKSTWDGLLQAYRPWGSIYVEGKGANAAEVPNRASMNPGTALAQGFWRNWYEGVDAKPSIKS